MIALKPSRIRRWMPIITDCFVLSFTFFVLSDLHQILRDPTFSNLVRVVTSLQFTANSPFDYPAFLFMGLVIANLIGALVARVRSHGDHRLSIAHIPLSFGELTMEEARGDCLRLARDLRKRADASGVTGEVRISSISASTASRALTQEEIRHIQRTILETVPGASAIDASVHNSALTDALFRISTRLGIAVGGMYHPLQHKMSLNTSLGALVSAYVYTHESFHSFGFGEIDAEIGTVEVCLRLDDIGGMPLGVLARYILFRAAASYLGSKGQIEGIRSEIEGLHHGFQGPGGFLLRLRKDRLERGLYEALKTRTDLIR